MQDSYGRSIDYLRISVTDRCNLRCRYCMPQGIDWAEHDTILRYEEILQVARAAIAQGINCFKITGGEPLVRRGIVEFIKELAALPGCRNVTLTTNGLLLAPLAKPLAQAGLEAVNVSLDTLDPAQYEAITGFAGLPQVLESIQAAMQAGLRVKINSVLLADTANQIKPLARLAARWPVDVRFIELMPIGEGAAGGGYNPALAHRELLEEWPDLHLVQERRGNGPAWYEAAEGLLGRIGWIDAVSHGFCDGCNRVRLTSTGQLKPCLCYEQGVDLRKLLRSGASQALLEQTIAQAIAQKPKAHCFNQAQDITEYRRMAQIGG